MRISLIGLSGSGKTTLAEKISHELDIPHIHLDKIWMEASGHTASSTQERQRVQDHMRQKVSELIQQDAWVAEGWYGYVQPMITNRADQIIFLDISLTRRLTNHIRRMFFKRNRHAQISFGDDLRFIYKLIKRTYVHGPLIRNYLAEHPAKVTRLRTHAEADQYLATITGSSIKQN